MTDNKPDAAKDDVKKGELNDRLRSSAPPSADEKKPVPDGDAIADVGDAIGGPA